jgi:hypothetical protein
MPENQIKVFHIKVRAPKFQFSFPIIFAEIFVGASVSVTRLGEISIVGRMFTLGSF